MLVFCSSVEFSFFFFFFFFFLFFFYLLILIFYFFEPIIIFYTFIPTMYFWMLSLISKSTHSWVLIQISFQLTQDPEMEKGRRS